MKAKKEEKLPRSARISTMQKEIYKKIEGFLDRQGWREMQTIKFPIDREIVTVLTRSL
jgi:hypothetical protein